MGGAQSLSVHRKLLNAHLPSQVTRQGTLLGEELHTLLATVVYKMVWREETMKEGDEHLPFIIIRGPEVSRVEKYSQEGAAERERGACMRKKRFGTNN